LIDVTMTFLPLVKKCQGRVVNVSSIAGRLSAAAALSYNTSKFCVEGFSDGLRRSLRMYGCGVHIIEPGSFKTNITSDENIGKLLTNGWDALSPQLKDDFGPDYLQEIQNYITRIYHMEFFNRPSQVTDAITHALLGKHPQARYVVGNDAQYIFLQLVRMPEWLSDWILNLLGPLPKPAILKGKQH